MTHWIGSPVINRRRACAVGVITVVVLCVCVCVCLCVCVSVCLYHASSYIPRVVYTYQVRCHIRAAFAKTASFKSSGVMF